MKILLLYHPLCVHCPKAEELLNTLGLEYEKLSLNTVEGRMAAEKYGVQMVPAIIVENGGSAKVFQGYSSSLKAKVLKALEGG